MCQDLGWLVNLDNSELEPKQVCRLPVQSQVPSAEPARENTENTVPTDLSGPEFHVLYRSANSNRETSAPRSTAYETHTVASQKQLVPTHFYKVVRVDFRGIPCKVSC